MNETALTVDALVQFVAGGALLLALHGRISARLLRRNVQRTRHEVPLDPETGLMDHRAMDAWLEGELRRAARFHGSVWLGVWHVSPEALRVSGSAWTDSLTFPAAGFRPARDLVLLLRPNADEPIIDELVSSVEQALGSAAQLRATRHCVDGETDAGQVIGELLAQGKAGGHP